MDDVSFPGWQPEKSINVVDGVGMTRVFVKRQPYLSWRSGDEGCLRLAIVQLYQCGLGTEEELAAALAGTSIRCRGTSRNLPARECGD